MFYFIFYSAFLFFFFNDTATTEIYTLSLHDALPISPPACRGSPPPRPRRGPPPRRQGRRAAAGRRARSGRGPARGTAWHRSPWLIPLGQERPAHPRPRVGHTRHPSVRR